LPIGTRKNLEATLYLQTTVLDKYRYDFSFLRLVGQGLGVFQEFKGSGHVPGGKDYPLLVYL
jgi:hypothetical protein